MIKPDQILSVLDNESNPAESFGESDFWDFPRAPAATHLLIELGRSRGMDLGQCLAGSDIDGSRLDDPELEIEPVQELAVIRNLVYFCGNPPGLGVEAGRRVEVGMLGVWGFTMLSATTTRQVIEIAARHGYGRFSWVFCHPLVEERGGAVHTIFDSEGVPADVKEFLIARDLSFVCALLPQLFGTKFPAIVRTTLAGSHGLALASGLGDLEVEIGAERDEIEVAAQVLDAPVPNGNEHALRTLIRQCNELVAHQHRRTGIAGQVERALLRNPARTSLVQLARDLHMHPRTLGRHLEAEGTSFRETREAVHARLAAQLLTEAGLTVQQVADRLGYADAASFSHAFKRWTGQTPGASRRLHR